MSKTHQTHAFLKNELGLGEGGGLSTNKIEEIWGFCGFLLFLLVVLFCSGCSVWLLAVFNVEFFFGVFGRCMLDEGDNNYLYIKKYHISIYISVITSE